MGFFKLIMGIVILTILFFMAKEIMNVRKRNKAEDKLNDVRAEHDAFEMERQAVELERELEKKKEALYKEETEETETE